MFSRELFGAVTLYDIILAVAILAGAFFGTKLLVVYMRRTMKDRVSKDHLEIIVKISYYSILIIALLTILPLLGVQISGILLAGGFAGIIIGFASQNVVSNLISGVFLMIERPIKIGNAVNIDGTIGIVNDIKIMSTIVRTFEGLFVRIPNIKVFTGTLTNYVSNIARRFSYTIGIRYRDDADLAISIIKRIIENEPMALVNPAPMVFVTELGESSVNIQTHIWAPTTEWFALRNELLWKIKKSLEAEGIQIPFPQRVLWFEQSDESGDLHKKIKKNP
jgi:small-conductance mechanosensitive channel